MPGGENLFHAHGDRVFRDDILSFGSQAAVCFNGQRFEADEAAWQFREFLSGDFGFLHRFIEGDMTIESDSEKLEIGPSGGFEFMVETFRCCRIGKMNVRFGKTERRIEAAEEMFPHILPIAERMCGGDRRSAVFRIFIQIPCVKRIQLDSVFVQQFREQLVQTDHGVSGCQPDVDPSAFFGFFCDHAVDFFRSHTAHFFIIFHFYPVHAILLFAFSYLYYTLKKRGKEYTLHAKGYIFGASMKYYEGIDFAMADVQFGSRNSKKNYPFYYGLQLVYSGEIALSIDHGKEIRRKGPAAFLTSPEHYYEYSSPGVEARDHYWVCFYGPKTAQYREEELFRINPEMPFFRLRHPEEFKERMTHLIALVQGGREHDRAVCLLETLLFTLQADAELSPVQSDHYRDQFAELAARIAGDPGKEWNFEAEAKKMCVSLNHFNRLFRKYLGNSPRHCVIQARMRRAADLLLDSSRSVAEIAMLVGMENEFYFSRLFKKSFALSPSGYRKEFQGI